MSTRPDTDGPEGAVLPKGGGGLHLPPGEVPRHHVQAIREVLFQHGGAIAARVAGQARDILLVMPTARWSAAPLMLLRHLSGRRVTFVPVDSDADALDRVAKRVGTALPDVHVRPCLAPEPLFIPADAFSGPGRHALFVPWCGKADGAWDLSRLAPTSGLLGPDGCLLAGVQLRDEPIARVVDGGACSSRGLPWPADLRSVGVWCDARQALVLVLLERARTAPGLPAESVPQL